MSQTLNAAIAVAGIDIGKNSFHIVDRGPVISSAMVPLVKPDVRSYRIRLSPIPSDLRSRQVDPPAGDRRRDVFNKGRDFVASWGSCRRRSRQGTIPSSMITVLKASP
jgi:hypothetical protein